METKRVCSKCRRELPATTEYFHKNKYGKQGLQSVCKECRYPKYIHYPKKRETFILDFLAQFKDVGEING